MQANSMSFFATNYSVHNGCAQCRKFYEEGDFVILVVADDTKYFLLGVKPELQHVCCGEKKSRQVAVFSSKEAALAQAQEYERVFRDAPHDSSIDPIIPLLQHPFAQELAIKMGLVPPSSSIQ